MSDRDADLSALDKLQLTVLELKERREFSKEEWEAIDGMIRTYRGWMALGFVFGSFKQILIFVSIFAAAVVALRSGALEWLGLGK